MNIIDGHRTGGWVADGETARTWRAHVTGVMWSLAGASGIMGRLGELCSIGFVQVAAFFFGGVDSLCEGSVCAVAEVWVCTGWCACCPSSNPAFRR